MRNLAHRVYSMSYARGFFLGYRHNIIVKKIQKRIRIYHVKFLRTFNVKNKTNKGDVVGIDYNIKKIAPSSIRYLPDHLRP